MSWRERVEEELRDLVSKMEKLTDYLNSNSLIETRQVELLTLQLKVMASYEQILAMRLSQ